MSWTFQTKAAGQALGPYPVSHCRHWVHEGRLNGASKVPLMKVAGGDIPRKNGSFETFSSEFLYFSGCRDCIGFNFSQLLILGVMWFFFTIGLHRLLMQIDAFIGCNW